MFKEVFEIKKLKVTEDSYGEDYEATESEKALS